MQSEVPSIVLAVDIVTSLFPVSSMTAGLKLVTFMSSMLTVLRDTQLRESTETRNSKVSYVIISLAAMEQVTLELITSPFTLRD